MATFPYSPDWGCQPTMTPSRIKTDMGDGYEQRVGAGINRFMPTWPLTFSKRTQTEAQAISTWLRTNNADITSFDWTSPDGTTGKFVADDFIPPYPVSFNNYTITAKFRQVPG